MPDGRDHQVGDQPQQIGRYKILRTLGEGGMGVVYEAEQSEPVHRRVALKILKLGMDTKQVVARFEAERQALAVMDHPSIARVFDGGATETGRPYFAMELVKGTPIAEYCDTHKLSTDERLALFTRVCAAIQHAHQKGVIHRDLKPSNVLVTVEGDVPVPKVIDFGIAKAVGQALTDKTLVTRLGQFVGTPEYMSPEQAEMSGVDVDTRTDIYSLGVMLYELLVGAPPYDLKGVAEFTIRTTIREKEAPRPSARFTTLSEDERETVARYRHTDPGSLKRALQGDLDWVVMKCLEKDRTRRYHTASELALELERILDNQPVAARPPSTSYRLQKFVRRNRTAVAAGVVSLLAIVGGASAAVIGMVSAQRAEAETAREATTAQEVSDFLVGLFEVSDPSETRGNTITAREILDAGAERIRGELEGQPEVQGRLMATMGQVYRKLGLYGDAQALLEQALSLEESREPVDVPRLANILNSLATLYEDQGRYEEAEPLYRRALEQAELAFGPEHASVAAIVNNLAKLTNLQGRYDDAEVLYERALAINEKVYGPDHPETAINLGNLAVLHRKLGRYDEAEELQKRALAIAEETLGEEHPTYTTRLINLGALYMEQGKYDEAGSLYERALEIDERVLGPEHPYVAADLTNLSNLYLQQGRDGEAEEPILRALEIDRVAHGPEHPAVGDDLIMLARLNARRGRYEEAERGFTRGVEILEAGLGADHPRVAEGLRKLGAFYSERGRFEEAERLIGRSLGILRRSTEENPAGLAVAVYELALLYTRTDRLVEAEPLFQEALAIRERILPDDHPRIAETVETYADLLRRLGRPAEAVPLEERAARIRN